MSDRANRTELVQARVSKAAKDIVRTKAAGAGISEAAYVRQVLYKALGIYSKA